jgi:hypothetical protein
MEYKRTHFNGCERCELYETYHLPEHDQWELDNIGYVEVVCEHCGQGFYFETEEYFNDRVS